MHRHIHTSACTHIDTNILKVFELLASLQRVNPSKICNEGYHLVVHIKIQKQKGKQGLSSERLGVQREEPQLPEDFSVCVQQVHLAAEAPGGWHRECGRCQDDLLLFLKELLSYQHRQKWQATRMRRLLTPSSWLPGLVWYPYNKGEMRLRFNITKQSIEQFMWQKKKKRQQLLASVLHSSTEPYKK